MFDKIEEVLARADSETTCDYIDRVCGCREEVGLTWEELAKVINAECGLSYDESHYRKNWKNTVAKRAMAAEGKEDTENLKDILARIKKERVKLSDERVQYNADFRKLSREETIKEIAHDFAVQMNGKKILSPYSPIMEGKNNSAILQISDWHYGIVVNNYWNQYDPEIAEQRISKLRDEVIRRCLMNNVNELHVVNLSDLICGRIHLPLRLQSRFDVITQIMKVSEILAEFLHDLSRHFKVHYYDCIDNHSRLEPNKSENIDLESLARITTWYLKERLSDNIVVHDNNFGLDIITFTVKGFKIAAVHGDKDKPSAVIDSLSLMTHDIYDLVLTAHLHHFIGDEKNETLMLSNGSLMGTDEYAKNCRLSAKPSQNLIIVTDDNVMDTLYRIVIK